MIVGLITGAAGRDAVLGATLDGIRRGVARCGVGVVTFPL